MALLLCSCGPGAQLPGRPQQVSLVMREYGFEFVAPTHGGRTVIDIRNEGRLRHDLVLAQLPRNAPRLTFDPSSPRRAALATVATLQPLEPGSTDSLAVDLATGQYAVLCFVRDGDGVQHIFKGMHAQFAVG